MHQPSPSLFQCMSYYCSSSQKFVLWRAEIVSGLGLSHCLFFLTCKAIGDWLRTRGYHLWFPSMRFTQIFRNQKPKAAMAKNGWSNAVGQKISKNRFKETQELEKRVTAVGFRDEEYIYVWSKLPLVSNTFPDLFLFDSVLSLILRRSNGGHRRIDSFGWLITLLNVSRFPRFLLLDCVF